MLGKNYDQEIEQMSQVLDNLVNSNNNIMDSLTSMIELFKSLEETVELISRVQTQQKLIVSFLMKHITLSEACQEDAREMMQGVIKLEKEIKEIKEGKLR